MLYTVTFPMRLVIAFMNLTSFYIEVCCKFKHVVQDNFYIICPLKSSKSKIMLSHQQWKNKKV